MEYVMQRKARQLNKVKHRVPSPVHEKSITLFICLLYLCIVILDTNRTNQGHFKRYISPQYYQNIEAKHYIYIYIYMG